jgi:uncharacterized protein Yka (UPF0111/DUF47 family)
MDLWSVLEERISQHGVRVEERLRLLAQLRSDHETGESSVAARKEELVRNVEAAADRLKEKLRS